MAWPLRTTGEEDLAELIGEIYSGQRKFLWIHCHTESEWKIKARQCQNRDLIVLDQVPCWFLLACSKQVPKVARLRMMESITISAGLDSYWRGQMFGYSEQDIDWFGKEINAAMLRIQKYRRSL